MRAVIMAGGKGRRLYPYTMVLPKPLVPLGEQSILEIVVRQLAYCGFNHVTIAVGYHADLIMAVMGDGRKFGIKIDYSQEETPLGTIGPLNQIQNLDEPFLVMNGDLLTDLDYYAFYEQHIQNNSIATIATYKRNIQLSLGVILHNTEKRVTSFKEKPSFNFNVSMGVYLFDPRVKDFIPKHSPFGFDQLMDVLIKSNETVSVYPFDGHWLDMGTHEDLDQAMEEFNQHKDRYLHDV